jgi:hypothetical protein
MQFCEMSSRDFCALYSEPDPHLWLVYLSIKLKYKNRQKCIETNSKASPPFKEAGKECIKLLKELARNTIS